MCFLTHNQSLQKLVYWRPFIFVVLKATLHYVVEGRRTSSKIKTPRSNRDKEVAVMNTREQYPPLGPTGW